MTSIDPKQKSDRSGHGSVPEPANRRQLTLVIDYPEDFGAPAASGLDRVPEALRRIMHALSLPRQAPLEALVSEIPELSMLTGRVNATPESALSLDCASISERLTGEKHIELDRTAVGIMVLNAQLEGAYEWFTESQPEGVRLSRESFEELRDFTCRVLNDEDATGALVTYIVLSNAAKVRSEAWDAMLTYMAINDLTKVKPVIEEIKSRWKIDSVDHDKALYSALLSHPEISPSFQRLSPAYRDLILEGLSAEFNVGQLAQAECPAQSLSKLASIGPRALNFYLLHALCDIAGAAGHVSERGSIVMTEPTYRSLRCAIDALEGFSKGQGVEEVYRSFLEARAAAYSFDAGTEQGIALTRVACMMRLAPSEAAMLERTYHALPGNVRAILDDGLSRRGTSDGYAVLPYYVPAMFANLAGAFKGAPDGREKAASLGMTLLARALHEGRQATKGRDGSGVFTLFMSEIASAALLTGLREASGGSAVEVAVAKNPDLAAIAARLGEARSALDVCFARRGIGQDAELLVAPGGNISPAEPRRALSDVPQLAGVESFVAVGVGGGSDAVQAAILGSLLEGDGERICRGVIAVGKREVGSAVELADGVYEITPESVGRGTSGRFLEPLASKLHRTLLVVDRADGKLSERLAAAAASLGESDALIAVDTGGDALYGASVDDEAQATPDQDLRALLALRDLGKRVVTCEIACGVDAPADAQLVLERGGASYFDPDPAQTERVLSLYADLGLDGSSDEIFGKTCYAWQEALRGTRGVACLPLPPGRVLDPRNPWNPFVHISESMRGAFFMDLEKHLAAIGLS